MVHSHENIKLSNKEEILNKINEQTNVPMSKEIFKHKLIENGISSYDFKTQDTNEFTSIIDTFKKLSKGNYKVVDFWFNKYNKEGCVKPHNHKPIEDNDLNWLAGVYYPLKDKNSGNLILNKKELNIQEDDFILFDIEDIHSSLPNKSNERIVFSINMKECNE
tara:strand:+ start:758 stop:1246 length:489 start_codon:yes stop_codon:yes gene_type:complete